MDIGANVGYDSLLGSALVGPTGCVVAIEASPKIYEKLVTNIGLNAAANIRPLNVAASDRVGQLEIFDGPQHSLGTTSTIASRGMKSSGLVDAAPLDALLSTKELSRLRLIKMDIEGGEPTVLDRILETLELYPLDLQIIVEVSFQSDPTIWQSLFDRLERVRFHAYAIENEYDDEYYLNWRAPRLPRRITKVPNEQTDVLFSRQPLP